MILLFYILVFTLAIPNLSLLAHHVGPLTVLKCFGILCLVAAVFVIMRMGKCPPLAKEVKSRWFVAYILVAVISCFAHDGLSAFGQAPLMFTVSTFSLFLMTLTFVQKVEHVRWAVLTAMVSVAWGSLYVIRQWLEYHSMIVDFRSWGGLAGDPNYYAVTVVLWTPLILLWLIGNRPRWEKLLCLLCLAPILVGFILAASRGGFLGLAAALLLMIWYARRRARAFVIVALLMVPVLLAPGNGAVHRLLHPDYSDTDSTQYRLELWQAAENVFLEHPIVGEGMGHFQPWIMAGGQRINLPFHVAHNTYVGLLADLGLAGTIPFIVLLLAAQIRLRRLIRTMKDPLTPDEQLLRRVALGLRAGLLGYMVCAFFLSTLWQQVFWFALFLSMCLPRIYSSLAQAPDARPYSQEEELVRARA